MSETLSPAQEAEARSLAAAIAEAAREDVLAMARLLVAGPPEAAFGENEVRSIRQLHPELIILDLGEDPEMGIKLASFLGESTPGRT